MIRAIALSIAASMSIASIARANAPDDYATVFAIDTSAANSSAWRVELTPDVYRWIRSADLSDVELFNASGAPIPFAWTAREASVAMHDRIVALPVLLLPATKSDAGADLTRVIDRGTDRHLRRGDAGIARLAARRECRTGSHRFADAFVDCADVGRRRALPIKAARVTLARDNALAAVTLLSVARCGAPRRVSRT